MSRYADWKAPKTDMEHLIWPVPRQIMQDTRANQLRLSKADDVLIQNAPLPELRRATREFLNHHDDRPIVATGHQIELYHPGVWVKNALLDALQESHGVRSLHIAVDTDTPKHLQLRWPGGAIDVSDDLLLKTGEWSGQVAQPTPAHLQKMIRRFHEAAQGWSFEPSIEPFFEAMRQHAMHPLELPAALLQASQALDHDLGLHYEAMILSPMLLSPGYLALAHQIGADIERFSRVYNESLAAYRAAEGISSPTRPMPDLRIMEDAIELPFWFDNVVTGDRSRATVARDDAGKWNLLTDDAAFTFDPRKPANEAVADLQRFCAGKGIRLAPRALTLTIFFRLLLVDQFVHGIGGGRYDQVTDRLIEHYFGLQAPAFSVTTGTMYFPDARRSTEACVSCMVTEGHRLRHSLIGKAPHLQAIGSAPRKSNARKTAYLAMHRELAVAVEQKPDLPAWRQRLQETIEREQREKVLFDRELFYAVQTRERLTAMIDRYRIAVA